MNTFRTFAKRKNDTVSDDVVVIVFFVVICLLIYLNNSYLNFSWLQSVLNFIGGFGILLWSILSIKAMFTTEKINGSLDGTLALYEDRIIIKQQVYLLIEIESIDLSVTDYLGAYRYHDGDSIEPSKSNGTGNWIELTLISKKKCKTYFQQPYEGAFIKNRDELIAYHLEGKISFLRLIDILGITKYEDIQAFKKTIN